MIGNTYRIKLPQAVADAMAPMFDAIWAHDADKKEGVALLAQIFETEPAEDDTANKRGAVLSFLAVDKNCVDAIHPITQAIVESNPAGQDVYIDASGEEAPE